MSYTRHTWNNEVISDAKLNNIEDGIEEAMQSGGGYDAEIKIYHDNNSSHDYELTIVSGIFADLYDMISNNVSPIILVRVFDELLDVRSATTAVAIYTVNASAITFMVKAPKQYNSGTYSNDWQFYNYLVWASDDTLGLS